MWALRVIGLIYLLSALWCLIQMDVTLAYLGIVLQNDLAKIEYLTVYGGLQLGLALAMLLSSFVPLYVRAALLFSAVFSSVLVMFRYGSMFLLSTFEEAFGLALLELFIALVLWFSYYRNSSVESLS